MRIEIETDGNSAKTSISINRERIETLKEFHLSVHYPKKVKLQMAKEIDNGKMEFLSYYGDDFKKYDEFNKPK